MRRVRTFPAVLVALAAFGLLAGCGSTSATSTAQGTATPSGPVRVSHAWIRVPVAGDRMTAAYATLKGGGHDDRLVGVRTPVAAKAQVHETVRHGKTESMEAMKSLEVRAGHTVRMKPGGKHIMVMGLRKSLHPGDRVRLEFRFARAGTVPVTAKARGFGDDHG